MKERPIIFLDFDGVLTTVRTRFEYLDPVAVTMLQQLVTKTNAEIVISSTWRCGATSGEISTYLKCSGWRGAVPFHECWATPNLKDVIRGIEIDEFFKRNPHEGLYLILDDDSDFTELQKPFHVKTDSHNGFLWDHFVKAHEILGVDII